ncbi:hypothetical protein C0416_01845 [bacterium]|nr:hypothetical protein [bacterium]
MKRKIAREILRKLFHLYQLPVILGYIVLRYQFSDRVAIFALVILLMFILEFEMLRLEWKVVFPDPFGIMRKSEKKNATGMLYMILATIVVFAVFDFKIALVALLLTVFGDLVSAIVGIQYGKHRIKNGKSWEGFGAGLLANIVVVMALLWQFPLVGIVMAVTASAVEFVTYKMDDNLTVPIFSAFAGHTAAFIIGVSFVQITNPLQDFQQFISTFL